MSVTLLAGGSSHDDIRSGAAYLRRAIRNQCYSWLRARRRDRSEPEPGAGLLLEPVRPVPQDDRLMLEQALRTLPPEQRTAALLSAGEEPELPLVDPGLAGLEEGPR